MMKPKSTSQVMIDKRTFMDMEKLRLEFDSIMETIEIMNDPALMEGVKRSISDVKSGRVSKIKSPDELDRLWQN